MLCEVVDYVVEHPEITEKMAVPSWCLKAIKESWDREPAFGSVYGRFDVCFGGIDHPSQRPPELRSPLSSPLLSLEYLSDVTGI